MSEIDAVLFANEAFYRAFADRDVEAMDEIWARDVPVACLHPGWPPLDGRDQVMQSWLSILANPDAPPIRCHDAGAHLYGDCAYVICYEEIEGQFLIATNTFVRQSIGRGHVWRLVHHQSGPTSGQPKIEEQPSGAVN